MSPPTLSSERTSNAALTTVEVATYPLPGTVVPTAIAFSPDDRQLTYLRSPDRSLSRQLFALDPTTGSETLLVEPPGGGVREENLSLEEKLRRERQRVRGLGVTSYAWAKHTNRVLVPLAGSVYVQDGAGAPLRLVVEGDKAPPLDPQMTRDGAHIAYVQDAELYVVAAEPGPNGKPPTPKQITKGARGTGKTHGLAEYIAQEEMDRDHGFWWSHDGKYLAYTQVDETHIPSYRIVHQGNPKTGEGAQEDHAYPFAGEANAKVRLGVVPRSGGKTVWMDLDRKLGLGEDTYLARVKWFPDGSLTAQLENREQTELKLVRLHPKTGQATVLLHEKSEVWINLHHALHPLEKATGELEGGFVWASEQSGFRHLYVHDRSGKQLRALTSGEWAVDGLVDIDEDAGMVYYTAPLANDPTQKHLFVVPLAGGTPRQITQAAGMHGVALDHGYVHFVDIHSYLSGPPTLTLRKLADGSEVRPIPVSPDPRVAKLELQPPELVALKSRDGVDLHAAVYRPDPAVFGDGPYPTMVSVYGGPHAQRVGQTWGLTVDMRAQYFASRGILVFKLDNRGSARRGLAFEGALRHDMGNIEVQDQVDGVRYLVEKNLADPERVGMYGWSYGGYMSAMALARAPETFKVAVAGAPVTHWDGYDTHYTERYMGTPQTNPDGYEQSSVMAHVDSMQGHLLLVHGLIDENVHFRHTARLINALIAARKPYDLLLFPDERHMPRKLEDRVHMEDQIFAYLAKKL